MSPKRIAIVLQTPRDQHSAVLITYQSLAAELLRLGHFVSIVTPQDFETSRRVSGRWTPLLYPLVVARWMRKAECDLAVFHSYAGWRAVSVAASRGIATVVAFHGLEPMYHEQIVEETRSSGGLSLRYRLLQERVMPAFLRAACRGATLVTCLNDAERTYLIDRGWVSNRRIATVTHGVTDNFFVPPRPPRPARTLLFLGQWLAMKGVAALRAAFDTLARRHPQLRLICAGTLAGSDQVLASFSSDVRDRVTVIPRLDRPALAAVYREADVFVFPSNYEGFGVALVEAMASRLPIVTTEVGVAADALKDGISALMVPRRDPGAIVKAVDRILADDGLRSRLGDAAHAAACNYRETDSVRSWAHTLRSVDRLS